MHLSINFKIRSFPIKNNQKSLLKYLFNLIKFQLELPIYIYYRLNLIFFMFYAYYYYLICFINFILNPFLYPQLDYYI